MTNKEAIERLCKIKNFGGMTIPVSISDIEALDLAIKALEFKDIIDNGQPVNTKMKYKIEINGIPIEKLGYSSVTVEARSQGNWINHKDYLERKYGCNQCGNLNNIPSKFCPNCGSKMENES